MAKDIQPLGAGDGKAFYWVKEFAYSVPGDRLRLVVIDEYGEITGTPLRSEWDEAAMTRAEAVKAHLTGGIANADRDLERRRREAPEPKPKPPPVDMATRRFMQLD